MRVSTDARVALRTISADAALAALRDLWRRDERGPCSIKLREFEECGCRTKGVTVRLTQSYYPEEEWLVGRVYLLFTMSGPANCSLVLLGVLAR